MKQFRKKINKYQRPLGYVAVAMAIFMFLSMIEIINSNLSGSSNIIIQPLATSLTGLLWCIYAIGINDKFVFVPNFFALILGIITAISAFV